MKFKILLLLFFGMMNLHSQTTKKPIQNKKPTAVKTTAKVTAVKATPKTVAAIEGIFANISTNKGNIVVQLEYQKAPITVANFIALAEGTQSYVADEKLKGKPFYDGLKFHRVIKDFMIQGGDPLGNGSGDPGYKFKDEFTDLKHDKGGILSMANSGPTTNGSQFFITHKETSWLNGKHTIFGHVTQGMNVVNLIEQNDVITKVTITRKGAAAKKFDAPKVFADYFVNIAEDQKKQALANAENRKKQEALMAEAKKAYLDKYGSVLTAKVAYLNEMKATATQTASGLQYKLIQKGTDKKPSDGTNVFVHYAGYLEDGSLFDSSYEEVNKTFGKFDQNRSDQKGYQPFPFQCGRKDGLIPGFLEGLNTMSFGDKMILFIPSKLGYGERGAGNVIPPNCNIIFELELLETAPNK
jgi:cyclophilin family peptidyl-prolyl cis-trans isomerase